MKCSIPIEYATGSVYRNQMQFTEYLLFFNMLVRIKKRIGLENLSLECDIREVGHM